MADTKFQDFYDQAYQELREFLSVKKEMQTGCSKLKMQDVWKQKKSGRLQLVFSSGCQAIQLYSDSGQQHLAFMTTKDPLRSILKTFV